MDTLSELLALICLKKKVTRGWFRSQMVSSMERPCSLGRRPNKVIAKTVGLPYVLWDVAINNAYTLLPIFPDHISHHEKFGNALNTISSRLIQIRRRHARHHMSFFIQRLIDWFLYYRDKYRYNTVPTHKAISIPSHIGLISHYGIWRNTSEHMAWNTFKLQTSPHEMHYCELNQCVSFIDEFE